MNGLNISSQDKGYIQQFVDGGDTVIVPENILNIGDFSGVVFIYENIGPDTFSEGDGVLGGDTPTHGAYLVSIVNAIIHAVVPGQTNSGDPVNLGSGSFVRTETDISVPNVGLPLDFVRYYVSGRTADDGFGAGWTDTYSDTMVTQMGGDVLWTDSQGNQWTFTPNGGGYTDPAGIFGALTMGTDGFIYTDTDGTALFQFQRPT